MKHREKFLDAKLDQVISLVEEKIYIEQAGINPFRYYDLGDTYRTGGTDIAGIRPKTLLPGDYWGGREKDFIFETEFTVPGDWPIENDVALHLPIGDSIDFSHPEALVYIDDEYFGSCDRHHREIVLPGRYRDSKPHKLLLKGWTGTCGFRLNKYSELQMQVCRVVCIDPEAKEFAVKAKLCLETIRLLDENEPVRAKLVTGLYEACRELDVREPLGEGFYSSLSGALRVLNETIKTAGQAMNVNLTSIGHAHIDVAWLWDLDQTRNKCARTFGNVVNLMDRYEDFHFLQSQPQLYDYLKEDYPELFARIKDFVKQGRWELIGGMWVESDCNVAGAESLARQFLLGRNFFRHNFGPDSDSPVLWLPDVFGYCHSLPQLIKQAGLEYFFTTKISWNQYNKFPYDTFWWQGIDGTKVLTHFGTTPAPGSGEFDVTYNGTGAPSEILGTWTKYKNKEQSNNLIYLFGYGDGGGGPTSSMLDNLKELNEFPAMPRVNQQKAGQFFAELEQQSGDKVPVFNDELYLEKHRGCYTTQARTKRGNRKSEFILHDAEFLASAALLLDEKYRYPARQFNQAWKTVCLHQFHDILPGSSIKKVYDDAERSYREVENICGEVKQKALEAIGRCYPADILVINPTSFERDDYVLCDVKLEPDRKLQKADGSEAVFQQTGKGLLIDAGRVAPYSVTGLNIVKGKSGSASAEVKAVRDSLENEYVKVELDEAGDIKSIYDKQNEREVLTEAGTANEFQACLDRPVGDCEAWDIDHFIDEHIYKPRPAESVEIIESGPLRAVLKVKRQILDSPYTQYISIDANSPAVDIETEIDWQNRRMFLKSAFEFEVHTSEASYEIQFANIKRPTHRNTSMDWAKFEVPHQKWVDLSEGDYGVSLINDCKYGCDTLGSRVRLSLLRGTEFPDTEADLGKHSFKYRILPHKGAGLTETISSAYCFNDPLIGTRKQDNSGCSDSDRCDKSESFFAVDCENIVIETVKAAEDGSGWVVRMYESQRTRGKALLSTNFKIKAAGRCGLLENIDEQLRIEGNSIVFSYRPFEIINIKISR